MTAAALAAVRRLAAAAVRSLTRAAVRRFAPAAVRRLTLAAAVAAAGCGALAAPLPPGEDVGFTPPRDGRLAVDAAVVDERGETVPLGSLLGGTSLIVPAYYRCPSLCDLTLDGVAELVAAAPRAARPADVVVLSFAASETPADAAAMRASLASRHPEITDDPHWHFLTAAPASVESVMRSIGFRFARDAESSTYSHVAGIVVAAADGRLLGLLPGVRFAAARLAELTSGKSSRDAATPPPSLLLWCFHYDPQTGRYTVAVLRALEAATVLCVAALAAGLFALSRRRARRHGP
jgi:protein SCO1/2